VPGKSFIASQSKPRRVQKPAAKVFNKEKRGQKNPRVVGGKANQKRIEEKSRTSRRKTTSLRGGDFKKNPPA